MRGTHSSFALSVQRFPRGQIKDHHYHARHQYRQRAETRDIHDTCVQKLFQQENSSGSYVSENVSQLHTWKFSRAICIKPRVSCSDPAWSRRLPIEVPPSLVMLLCLLFQMAWLRKALRFFLTTEESHQVQGVFPVTTDSH